MPSLARCDTSRMRTARQTPPMSPKPAPSPMPLSSPDRTWALRIARRCFDEECVVLGHRTSALATTMQRAAARGMGRGMGKGKGGADEGPMFMLKTFGLIATGAVTTYIVIPYQLVVLQQKS
ncbi:hypothetical protein AB1Y20_012080 [Prymnesium parvum]|uniref:Uncharacterized protein n=1 Tax=Prymnesium parvum TaxID=97485 RepID=A0AB34IR43_PRYPA